MVTVSTEQDVKAAHEVVRGLTAQTDTARAARDTLIRQALTAGVTSYRVAQWTGLTERAVRKIRDA